MNINHYCIGVRVLLHIPRPKAKGNVTDLGEI